MKKECWRTSSTGVLGASGKDSPHIAVFLEGTPEAPKWCFEHLYVTYSRFDDMVRNTAKEVAELRTSIQYMQKDFDEIIQKR